ESGRALESFVDACPFRRTGVHFAGTCASVGACPFRRTGVHPRIKSGGRLSPGHALADPRCDPHATGPSKVTSGSRIPRISTMSSVDGYPLFGLQCEPQTVA